MKINSLNWPKCPHCNLTINDMTRIPASLFFEGCGTEIECPKCKYYFEIESRIEVTFVTYVGAKDENL